MPSRPAVLVDEELRRVLADPDVRASLDAQPHPRGHGRVAPQQPDA
jgi:hypothetical protein